MSDSDTDRETNLLPNNFLTVRNQGTTICAKGPNINSTNISSLNFRNNTMSTMNMPWNMNRPRYAESLCDPRSMSYRREREVSPESCRSASGLHPLNFQHSHYTGLSSHRSMYNGRSGSPMSVRSSRTVDSNISMSAKDIAFALQNGHFNKFDLKIIKEACRKYTKSRQRRRVEKKRNIRTFLKGFRRRSGGDSGDQASNSSISSEEDCQSTRSAVHKNFIPSCRSTITDMSQIRRAVRENDMVRDLTDNFRQNSFKKMLPIDAPCVKESTQPRPSVQKDRFKGNFLLPSQRFSQSVVLSFTNRPSRLASICEGNMQDTRSSKLGPNIRQENRTSDGSDSEQDEIFGKMTVMEKSNNGKRSLEDSVPVSESKRKKILSSQKNDTKSKTPKHDQLNTSIIQKSSDFVFTKPQLPIKKLGIVKSSQKKVTKAVKPQNKTLIQNKEKSDFDMTTHSEEKLISSSQRAQEKLICRSTQILDTEQSLSRLPAFDEQEKQLCSKAESTQFSTIDMSMRPSFIKRKLFSQKVDETAKNSSSDSLQAESPQTNIYSKIQKEKNKARKLATQSCLNRDVGDDSNLLDLIHKVVPPDRMNVTAVNRSELPNNKSKPYNNKVDETTKWDVTTIISTCNDKDVSDTYTDEDIFGGGDKETQDQNKVTKSARDDRDKIRDKDTQKCQVKKQKESADKCNAISLIEKQNKIVESKQNNSVETKENKIIAENQCNSKSKQSKKHENQIDNKLPKQNVAAVEKRDKGEVYNHSEIASANKDVAVAEKQGETLPEKQVKNTAVKNKAVIQNQNSSVVLNQNTGTAETQNMAGIEKQKKIAVDKKSVALDKQSHLTQPKTTPPKFLVVMQKRTPQDKKELSPTDRNGLIRANVHKAVKSFWDTDTESEFEATPMKRAAQIGQLETKSLVKQAVIDTVIEDISSVSQLIKSPNKKKLIMTLERCQEQSFENLEKITHIAQKEINIEHTEHSSNKREDANRGKGNSRVAPKPTSERVSPVSNKNNKIAPKTKQNQPPTENSDNKKTTAKSKQKPNTTLKTDNHKPTSEQVSPVKKLKHVSNRNNKTAPKAKENQPPTENSNNKKTTAKSKQKPNTTLKTDNHKPTSERVSPVKKLKHVSNRNNKTAPKAKENQPPTENSINKKATAKSKQKSNTTLKTDKKTPECHLKVHNITLKIRPQRNTKVRRCFNEPDSTDLSAGDSSLHRTLRSRKVVLSPDSTILSADDSSLYRTLRTRKVDLSTSFKL